MNFEKIRQAAIDRLVYKKREQFLPAINKLMATPATYDNPLGTSEGVDDAIANVIKAKEKQWKLEAENEVDNRLLRFMLGEVIGKESSNRIAQEEAAQKILRTEFVPKQDTPIR